MNHFLSGLVKGLKIGGIVLASGAGYGLAAVSQGWRPPSVGNPVADGLLAVGWNGAGIGAVAALGASLIRWATYDPKKDPKNNP